MRRTTARWLCLLLAVTPACAQKRFPAYEPALATSYHRATDGTIELGARAIPSAECERLFGRDLLASGVQPIDLVIENRSPSRSFFLLPEAIRARDAQSVTIEDRSRSGEAMATVGAVVLSLPLMLVGGKLAIDAQERTRALQANGLYAHTLSPGETERGYVLFPIDATRPPYRWWIAVELADAGDESTHTIEVELDFDPGSR